MSASDDDEIAGVAPLDARHVRVMRLGHGANCSSIGSVVDTLFVASAVGGALLAAVAAALRDGNVRVVGAAAASDEREPPAPPEDPADAGGPR